MEIKNTCENCKWYNKETNVISQRCTKSKRFTPGDDHWYDKWGIELECPEHGER